VGTNLATAGRLHDIRSLGQIRILAPLVRAGFRRYATYRQATIAASFTNSVFGFLRCFVILAAAAGAAAATVAGYDREQLATYCWLSQGLIGTVLLCGWTELSDRIRTGDVLSDLLRPVDTVMSYLAVDLGRAGHAALTRFVIPLAVGAIFFDLYIPRQAATYPLFAVSVLFGIVVSFGCRYLVNATGYWLLDTRGVNVLWTFCSVLLVGLSFPLHFLPGPLVIALWVATPLPSILQASLDVAVERGPASVRLGLVAGQAAWAVVLLLICRYVQRRAERKLVIQGG